MSLKPRFHYLLYISWNFLANSLFASPLQRQQDRLPQPLMETMALQSMSTAQNAHMQSPVSLQSCRKSQGDLQSHKGLFHQCKRTATHCRKLKANLAGKKPCVHSAPSTQGHFSVVTARGPVHAQRQQK